MPIALPSYHLVNGCPVKLVETADGGMDVLALDLETGEFVRRLEYLSRVTLSDPDADEVNEERFNARVDALRAELAAG